MPNASRRKRRSSFSLRASLKPFGIGEQRPNNFSEVSRAMWENRDQARYAWRIRGRALIAPVAPGNLQVHWPEANSLLARDARSEEAGIPDYNTRAELTPS